jgi:hypothetical protein|tara:strand:+ start:220 stop:423 length:204 start_codon:yes stop_codon:yes gene_type:complete
MEDAFLHISLALVFLIWGLGGYVVGRIHGGQEAYRKIMMGREKQQAFGGARPHRTKPHPMWPDQSDG